MQVDFYQLSRDSAEVALARVAAKALGAGLRMLVVADDEALLARIGSGLWAHTKESFLPSGMAGGPDDARQPILLATSLEAGCPQGPAANGASVVVFADGLWRTVQGGERGFSRALLLFDEASVVAARAVWLELGAARDMQRAFWKQDGGRWVKAR